MAACPVCKEEVKEGATKCRHCFSNINQDALKRGASKKIELTIDHTVVRVFYIVSFILGIFLAMSFAFYGFNLEDLRGSLRDEINSAEKLQKDFRERIDRIDAAAKEAEDQLSELTDKLIKLGAGLPDDPDDKGASILSDMLSQIKSIQKGIESNRNEIQLIKKEALDALTEPGPRPETSYLGSTDLRDEVQIKQESVEGKTTTNSEGKRRQWYTITYQVVAKDDSIRAKVLDSIEKVVYVFRERWYTNPRRVSFERSDNFRYSINVWGVTSVKFEIHIKGTKDILTQSSYMITGDNEQRITDGFNVIPGIIEPR